MSNIQNGAISLMATFPKKNEKETKNGKLKVFWRHYLSLKTKNLLRNPKTVDAKKSEILFSKVTHQKNKK